MKHELDTYIYGYIILANNVGFHMEDVSLLLWQKENISLVIF